MILLRCWKFNLVFVHLIVGLTYSIPLNGTLSRRSLKFWQVTDTICNPASICREEFSSKRNAIDAKELGNQLTTCCTECSCSGDCAERSNCCFNDFATPALIDRSEQECLYPTNVQPQAPYKYDFSSYFMYTKHPRDVSLLNKNVSTCGDINIMPPVYSKTTERIYKNIKCANEFGVNDGITWKTFIQCSKIFYSDNTSNTHYLISLDGLILDLYKFGQVDGCELIFVYPGDRNDIKSEKCYQDLIETCDGNDIDLPPGLKLTRDEIREFCESGLFSPYVISSKSFIPGNYGNIFCALCRGEDVDERSHICSELVIPERTGSTSFRIFIDSSFSLGTSSSSSFDRYPKACKKNQVEMTRRECRTIFCPSAQYRNADGACVFAVSQLFVSQYLMSFKLTFHQRVTAKDVQALHLSDIIHPLRASWRVTRVFSVSTCYSDKNKDDEVDFLVIQIKNTLPVSRPSTILSLMKKSLLGKWYINLNGSRKPAEIDYGPNYFFCYEDGFCAEKLQERNISMPCWREIATDRVRMFDIIIITKLFVCDQIELYSGEFEFVNEHLILDKLSENVFYNAEFAVVKDFRNRIAVRICINDSVFDRNDFYVKVTRHTYLGIFIILFILWVI